jgi:hypothetical protein
MSIDALNAMDSAYMKLSGRASMKMRIERDYMPLVRIDAPELFRDSEFMAWLNDNLDNIATWHQGGDANEYSDLFITIDGTEGSNSDMPDHLWDLIVNAVHGVGVENALVWIANIDID